MSSLLSDAFRFRSPFAFRGLHCRPHVARPGLSSDTLAQDPDRGTVLASCSRGGPAESLLNTTASRRNVSRPMTFLCAAAFDGFRSRSEYEPVSPTFGVPLARRTRPPSATAPAARTAPRSPCSPAQPPLALPGALPGIPVLVTRRQLLARFWSRFRWAVVRDTSSDLAI